MSITDTEILESYATDEIKADDLLDQAGTYGFLQLTNPERGRSLYRDGNLYLRETSINEYATDEQERRPTIPDGPAWYPISFKWMENRRDNDYRHQQETYDNMYDDLADADIDDFIDEMENPLKEERKQFFYGFGATITGAISSIAMFADMEPWFSVPLILGSSVGPLWGITSHYTESIQDKIQRNNARKDRYDEQVADELVDTLDDTSIYTMDEEGFNMLSLKENNEHLDLDSRYWRFTR